MNKELQNKLKIFFSISTAAFTMMHSVSSALGKTDQSISPMEMLHRIALAEIEKEEPDINLIDTLLLQMEQLAEQNKNKTRTRHEDARKI